MWHILENWKKLEAFNEVYEIVKTVVIVGKDRKIYKIEIRRDYSGSEIYYDARYFIQESYTVQPTHPKTGGTFDRIPYNARVWSILTNMPHVNHELPEVALSLAMGFLAKITKE